MTPYVADVIRWTESVWSTGSAETTTAAVLGRRTVTAQVVGRDAERLSLCILSEEWLNSGLKAVPLKTGERVRRKASLVCNSGCQRLAR